VCNPVHGCRENICGKPSKVIQMSTPEERITSLAYEAASNVINFLIVTTTLQKRFIVGEYFGAGTTDVLLQNGYLFFIYENRLPCMIVQLSLLDSMAVIQKMHCSHLV
jgi:hypothetical protein